MITKENVSKKKNQPFSSEKSRNICAKCKTQLQKCLFARESFCFVLLLQSLLPFRLLLSNYTPHSHHTNLCTYGRTNLLYKYFLRHSPF